MVGAEAGLHGVRGGMIPAQVMYPGASSFMGHSVLYGSTFCAMMCVRRKAVRLKSVQHLIREASMAAGMLAVVTWWTRAVVW